jgi:pSer/pThr/pTyr-binding forkhead associated (FHA) protein
MARLVIAPGSPAARIHTLSGDATTIGRNSDNAVVLDDPAASRLHARVSRRDDAYLLSDLNSSAGTHVTGRGRVEEIELQHGDRIRIGDTELLFELDAGASPSVGAHRQLPTAPVTVFSVRAAGPRLDEDAIAFKVPVPDGTGTGLLSGRRAEMLTKVAEALQSADAGRS